jgi:hypothetical protein
VITYAPVGLWSAGEKAPFAKSQFQKPVEETENLEIISEIISQAVDTEISYANWNWLFAKGAFSPADHNPTGAYVITFGWFLPFFGV